MEERRKGSFTSLAVLNVEQLEVELLRFKDSWKPERLHCLILADMILFNYAAGYFVVGIVTLVAIGGVLCCRIVLPDCIGQGGYYVELFCWTLCRRQCDLSNRRLSTVLPNCFAL